MQSVYIKTYGCQMNVYDSQRMAELLLDNGYAETQTPEAADMVILNTCHIREKAAEKIYSELGRIKKHKDAQKQKGKEMIIAVAGCVAQAEGDVIKKRAPIVDIVIGPEAYHHLPDMISDIKRKTAKHKMNLDFKPNEKFDTLPQKRIAKSACAFVTIQEGCDKFCTFCVVPYTRGKEYSRPAGDVISEIKTLATQNVVEVSLLGQNVDAYHGLDEQGKEVTLAQLIEKVSQIPQIKRIRYTTSHPNNFTPDIIFQHGINPKLMPYVHLPVQAGSNRILQAMNRKHTREKYFKIIENLRSACKNVALSSDFIVGFPGETDDDFAQTLDLVEKVQFAQSYSFVYSPRPGTPAAMKDLVPQNVASARLQKLQAVLKLQQDAFNKGSISKVMPVLFEGRGKKDGQIVGKSPYLQAVVVEIAAGHNAKEYFGKIFNVEITKLNNNSLFGRLI